MNILSDNFIANMYGPHFLAFYAAVIVATFIAARLRMRMADRTCEERVSDPPEPADPVEIALLRGDVNEVLRLAVVELVQRGYLEVRKEGSFWKGSSEKIRQARHAPGAQNLSALHRAVYNFFPTPRTAAELFADKGLKTWFDIQCGAAAQRLAEYRLVTPDEVKRAGYMNAALAAGVVLGLGSYKLLVALSKGKTNVGFLIIMALAGTIAVSAAALAPRVSRRGKAYLESLRERYARLRRGISGLTHAVDDSALVFAVALFGVSVLEGTPYQGLVSTFRKAASSGAAGCGGSGCGGSGCGGGGCGGGGCGGCGGS